MVAYDLTTDEMLFRLTSLEDASLNCTAEGEEVTDAVGAVITTLYRAKKGEFTATNSLISLDLAAAQYGAKKEVASNEKKITDYTYEIIDVAEGTDKVTLKHTPTDDIKWVYRLVDGGIADGFKAGAQASASEFVIDKAKGEITVPTGFTGKLYVDYQFETENAVRITNSASKFPESCKAVIHAYFRDRCNDNLLYSGKIIIPKGKLNPESIELALTSTGKHAFTMGIQKDYCADEGEDTLFQIIVAE